MSYYEKLLKFGDNFAPRIYSLAKEADKEIAELREALKANHAHWNYDDKWIKDFGVVAKKDCKYCQMIIGQSK
jgi:hypothetical protein